MTDKIVKEISKNINLTDKEISKILKKKYPKYFGLVRIDSLRRRVGYAREENNLNRPVSSRPLLEKDIAKYLKKYKEQTSTSISKMLHLKYPEFKLTTIFYYVHIKRQWET